MKTDEGTNGRSGERSERFPNRMFKYNRANLSYQEMFERRREEGDLFAVFQNDMGEIRVEYARVEDYDEFAFEQIERSSASQRRGLTAEDVYLLIGCTMMSRIHGYEFDNFVHLLDHELKQRFDMRKLIEWTNMNKAFFSSPAEDAVLADAEDQASLHEEYARVGGAGTGAL